jgi:hypothetical protein
MADLLPSFLQFKRKRQGDGPNRTGDGPNNTPEGATLNDDAPAAPKRIAPPLNVDPAAAEAPQPDPVTPAVGAVTPAGPVVTPEERRTLGALPLQHNAKGQTVGRPEYDDTGDRSTDLETYRQGLEAQRNPEHKGSRWWTALKEAGLGFITGGLPGAVVRGIHGAAAPNVEERRDRDREIARVEGEQGRVRAGQGWQAKLREAQEESALRTAQTEKVKVETAEIPKQNEAARDAKSQTRLLQQLRTAGRYKRGENAALDKKLDDAGMSVSDFEKGGKFQWHEAGGQVYMMDAGTGKIDYATTGGAAVQDRSKMPNAEGLTPAQAKQAEIASKNLQYREKKDAESLAQRQREHADRMALGRDSLAERVASRISSEASRKVTQGQAATRIKITLGRAKAWAEKENATWDDFVDALDANGVEITDK